MDGCDLGGDVVQRIDERLVVGGDVVVEVRIAAFQLRAQSAAVEDRQVNGGAKLELAASRGEEPAPAKRIETGGCGEIDIWEEFGLGLFAIVRCRLYLPARSGDVRTTRQQVGGKVVRQRDGVAYRQDRLGDLQSSV